MHKVKVKVSDALVQDVQLLGGCVLLQQLACDLPLGGQHDAVLG